MAVPRAVPRAMAESASDAVQFVIVEAFHRHGETSLRVCGSELELRERLVGFLVESDRYGQQAEWDPSAARSSTEALVAEALRVGRDLLDRGMDWGVVGVVRVDGRVGRVYSG